MMYVWLHVQKRVCNNAWPFSIYFHVLLQWVRKYCIARDLYRIGENVLHSTEYFCNAEVTRLRKIFVQ